MKDYAAHDRAQHDDRKPRHDLALRTIDVRGLNVLDIGAGTGGFLSQAREAGAARIFAIDPNPHHAQYFEARGIPYRIGDADTGMDFTPDLVTCFEVIEHVYDPNPIVALAAKLLKPGGTFVISTPNAFNLMRAFKFVVAQRHHDPLMDPVRHRDAQHIRAFSFRMVRDLLARHGFGNIRPLQPRLFQSRLSKSIIMAADANGPGRG